MTDEFLRRAVDDHLARRGLAVVDGHRGYLCQTGEPYIEATLVLRTEEKPCDQSVYAGAIASVIHSFSELGGTVYWRIRPEMEPHEFDPRTVKAYFRFRTSNKPAIYMTENESRVAAGLHPVGDA